MALGAAGAAIRRMIVRQTLLLVVTLSLVALAAVWGPFGAPFLWTRSWPCVRSET
jgi:hypothetical protein